LENNGRRKKERKNVKLAIKGREIICVCIQKERKRKKRGGKGKNYFI
jgi:hypothetical protein